MPSLTLIRARSPALHTIETNPSSVRGRQQHDLVRPRRGRQRGGAGEQLGADAEAAPGRRDLDGQLPAVGQGERRDADDVTADPGDHTARRLVVLHRCGRRRDRLALDGLGQRAERGGA